jgi:hypothetical protein
VGEMMMHHLAYQREIKELQKAQRDEWMMKVVSLTDLVQKAVKTG